MLRTYLLVYTLYIKPKTKDSSCIYLQGINTRTDNKLESFFNLKVLLVVEEFNTLSIVTVLISFLVELMREDSWSTEKYPDVGSAN